MCSERKSGRGEENNKSETQLYNLTGFFSAIDERNAKGIPEEAAEKCPFFVSFFGQAKNENRLHNAV